MRGRQSCDRFAACDPGRRIDVGRLGNRWTIGDWTMRPTLLPLAAMLLTSCTSSQKPSTTEQQPATYDQKYEEAAELVTIVHEQGSFLKALAQKARDGSLSESEEKALRRYNYLQDAISRWAADESPDVGVKEQDREDIDRIIDDHLVNPPPEHGKTRPPAATSAPRLSRASSTGTDATSASCSTTMDPWLRRAPICTCSSTRDNGKSSPGVTGLREPVRVARRSSGRRRGG